jgi:hypothetical protein
VHVLTVAAPTAVEYVPAAHLMQPAALGAEYVPLGHCVHVVAPPVEYQPGEHEVHGVLPLGETVPGGHGLAFITQNIGSNTSRAMRVACILIFEILKSNGEA